MDEIAFYNHGLYSEAFLSFYTSYLDTTDPDLFIYYTLEEAYNTTESSSLPHPNPHICPTLSSKTALVSSSCPPTTPWGSP